MNIKETLRDIIAQLDYELNILTKELTSMPSGYLNRTVSNKKITYFHTVIGRKKRTRTTIPSTKDSIRKKLCRKKFIETIIPMLEHNLGILKHAYKYAENTEPDYVISMLPPTYSDIPVSDFFYKEGLPIWLTEDYPHNEGFPEHKTYITSTGHMTRSKSEASIFNALVRFGIPFHYEGHIIADGYDYYPDFIIFLPNNKNLIWEHAGMMHDPDYREAHRKKLMHYEAEDIVLWDNLIVTYDYGRHGLPEPVIEGIINGLILPFLRNDSDM